MLEQSVAPPIVVESGLVSTVPRIGSMSTAVNWRRVGLFVAVTFTLTYALNLTLHLAWGYGNNVATGTLLQLQMLIPATVAVVLQLFVFKTSPIYHLDQGPRWFFYVYLAYVALFVLGAGAAIARPEMATMLTTANMVAQGLIVLFIVILRLVTGREPFQRAGLAGGKWWYYPLFGLFLAGAYAVMTALNALFELGQPADIQELYSLYDATASGSAGTSLVVLWLRIAADFLVLSPILGFMFFFGEEYGWRGYLHSDKPLVAGDVRLGIGALLAQYSISAIMSVANSRYKRGGKAMACEQIFLQQLRKRGFRLTAQREMILSILHDVEGLVTADEIYNRVRRISSAVDVSTVYRTLDLLQELDLVSSVDAGDGQRRYELLGLHGPHLHLVCQACGQVIGADVELARSLGEQLEDRYAFRAALDHLSIPGLCRDCASASSS